MIEYITGNLVQFIIQIVASLVLCGLVAFRFRGKNNFALIFITCVITLMLAVLIVIYDLDILFYFVIGLLYVLLFKMLFTKDVQTSIRGINHKETSEQINTLTNIDTLVDCCQYFSSRKIGALITIEQKNSLNPYISKAVKINAVSSAELLKTIFFPNTALHDGAVIMRGDKVMCAGAYFPLSQNPSLPSSYGTRHRAGIGITEESDAISIIVSEETGKISVSEGGVISTNLSADELKEYLYSLNRS